MSASEPGEVNQTWRPSATLETLRARARLYADVRRFFVEREVLEVDTPVMSAHATVDRHIESFELAAGGWLQTSPEFAMKRLLCAGAGPIFQIAPVFRRHEQGRHHNPEFRLLEWYRPGWNYQMLMSECEALLHVLLGISARFERITYRQAFAATLGFDAVALGADALARAAAQSDVSIPLNLSDAERADPDLWLDLFMSQLVGPRLGWPVPVFVFDFPASQAALARVRADEPPVAERFEMFWNGVELANGFQELTDATTQRARFEADQDWRRRLGKQLPPFDQPLIDALAAGMPECAGVALGLDRLLQLKLGLDDVARTMSFAHGRA